MACTPTKYQSLPPFLTMKTKEKSGTTVTVTQRYDPAKKQAFFVTYKGDMRETFEKQAPTQTYVVKNGRWKRKTKKGERVMHAPREAISIAKKMREEGGRALLVGGGVRDALMGKVSKDTDIEVYGISAERLEGILKNMEPDFVDTVGRSFGVLKAKFGEYEFDISIPRSESKQGEGHKGFEIKGDPNMDPKEAARRRDFTVNALALDPLTGEVVDYFGGRKDLAKGILRATDKDTFGDDPLRVLRAAQFAARFGFKIEKETKKICREITQKGEFKNLPPARIGEEWKKLLLKSPKPSVGLVAGKEMGAWDVLHPELTALEGVKQDKHWHPEGDVWEHTKMAADAAAEITQRENLKGDDALVIMLASLLHDIGKVETTEFKEGRWRAYGHAHAGEEPAKRFVRKMELGKDIEHRVIPLIKEHMFLAVNKHAIEKEELTKKAINRLAQRLEPASIQELVLVMEADVKGRATENVWRKEAGGWLLQKAKELKVEKNKAEPILMGRHLISELGWEPGPKFGKVLKRAYEAQLEGKINTKKEALEFVKNI